MIQISSGESISVFRRNENGIKRFSFGRYHISWPLFIWRELCGIFDLVFDMNIERDLDDQWEYLSALCKEHHTLESKIENFVKIQKKLKLKLDAVLDELKKKENNLNSRKQIEGYV